MSNLLEQTTLNIQMQQASHRISILEQDKVDDRLYHLLLLKSTLAAWRWRRKHPLPFYVWMFLWSTAAHIRHDSSMLWGTSRLSNRLIWRSWVSKLRVWMRRSHGMGIVSHRRLHITRWGSTRRLAWYLVRRVPGSSCGW
jgi:hypothetical protein